MSGKKYKGPLPLPKPTAIERFTGSRSTNKPTTAEEQERIANKMAKKFKKSPKAQRYEEGGRAISDADRARVNSILGESGRSISDADRRRISGMLGESGKAISNADRKRVKKIVSGYEEGGEVRGMGKAYQGGKRSCKVR